MPPFEEEGVYCFAHVGRSAQDRAQGRRGGAAAQAGTQVHVKQPLDGHSALHQGACGLGGKATTAGEQALKQRDNAGAHADHRALLC